VSGIEGNIDQVQYCDKIKNIVDFLGTRLSDEELMKIWKMQVHQTNMFTFLCQRSAVSLGVVHNTVLCSML